MHLAFGEIAVSRIYHDLRRWKEQMSLHEADLAYEKFLAEIFWRDFAYYSLEHFPQSYEGPFLKKFVHFPWEDSQEKLKAWKEGKTGYPLVDAAMRQLEQEKWMHNRARMIVGSFLVKDLLIHWKEGEKHFWELLFDADPCVNLIAWQWVAGCGVDAAPYFRIFNPELQSKNFDPKGAYIRKYLTELKSLPDKYIHTPWLAPQAILQTLDYPSPIVDHREAREKALDIFSEL